MMTLIAFFVCGLVFANDVTNNKYTYVVDLTQVKDDKLFVELYAPKIAEEEIKFYLPKIIPGTYSIADYGRFVSDLKAYDKKGRDLEVTRLDDNSWNISKAKKIHKITYWIEDSYDTELEGPDIFQPAGTNIEDGKNFVINTPGFFGYFEGMKTLDFEFNIISPEDFYGSTGLRKSDESNGMSTSMDKDFVKVSADSRVDTYTVENFDRLVDSPLMYAEADTALVQVANTEVLVSSYSPNKIVSAAQIAAEIEEVLMAQKEYLGGTLPVNKYAFIFYFTDQPVTSYGALEHSYSSMYYMPEYTIEQMRQQLRDFAAHEFFHIVTPLNIHSEEIHAFDFNDPKMSKHLWMYEGITEYFAGNVQVKYDLLSEDEYLGILTQKMNVASNFLDTVPFTDISKYTLEKYENQYYNVYQKGALIGMSLDILLRDLSDGEYGVQDMMADLSKTFGKDQAFKDEELFSIIGELTYPEVEEFLNTYVGGGERLPIADLMEKVGVNYVDVEKYMDTDLGISQQSIGVKAGKLFVRDKDVMNEFGQAFGFENGDVLTKINGKDMVPLGPEFGAYMNARQEELEAGKPFSYTVDRDGEEVTLSVEVFEIEKSRNNQLSMLEEASERQMMLRKAWLKPMD